MEKRIREYEKFIAEAAKHPDAKLREHHREMVQNFQHERLVHLLIMLFFIVLTLGLISFLAVVIATSKFDLSTVALAVLTLIMVIMSVFYVKHYYFLENHIQKLYDISSEMYKK